MKTSLSIWTAALVLSSISLLHGAPAVTNKPAVLYVVTGRDANSRIWERTVYRLDQSGKAVPKKTSYTELATGLHYQKNGQWVESKEQIDILPDGTAAATQGQHQAYFPSDV